MVKYFWFPFLSTCVLVFLIEVMIDVVYHPDFWDKTPWLLHDPYKGETFDRLILSEKLKQLIDVKPDIISIGDSSGFFSIQPNIVNRYLHGLKYVSFSTGANQAFDGYKGIAEYVLKNQPSVKYIVLNMYPNLIPSKEVFRKADLGPIIYSDLVSIKSKLNPPSAGFSPYAKSLFFYLKSYHSDEYPTSHKVSLEVHHSIKQTLGWAPEHDIPFVRTSQITPFYPDKEKKIDTMFGMFEKSTIIQTLTDFANLAKKYNVTLMIMFNPMPWQTINIDKNYLNAEKELMKFQKLHPEVIFLVDTLVTPWDPAKFGMFNHVSRAYVFESSERMGRAINKAIYDPPSLKNFHRIKPFNEFKIPYDIQIQSIASAEQKNAALAYYLYTATTDRKYWFLLSQRVRNELSKNQAFNWMVDDMKARDNYLNKKDITLNYDTSEIHAEVVALKNGYYCGNNRNVYWIKLSGSMLFGYKSKVQEVVEPVVWPEASNIIIPIIREGKEFKFDGYCSVIKQA